MNIRTLVNTALVRNGHAFLFALAIPLVLGNSVEGQAPQDKQAERKAKEETAREAEARLKAQEQKAAAVQAGAVANIWPDEQFEQWVFQQDGGVIGARRRFNAQLTLQIDELDRACKLTDLQKKKLQLMAHGDVKRFFDSYERAKSKFNGMKNDVQRINEIMQDINPLQMAVQSGMFSGDSLFAKSVRHTLTKEQLAHFEAVEQQRRDFRHRAQVELVVGMIDESTPLRESQRQKLIDLFVKEVKPSRSSGVYEYYVIMYRIGLLPDEKIKAVLNDAQWKAFSRQLAQYKGIMPALRQQGMLVEEEEPDPPAAKNEAIKP
jgi:hypothetical protein